tara:strand:- start:718 stop:1314 length:597 start_codon:yes stop_codon:yes gene_type:complete
MPLAFGIGKSRGTVFDPAVFYSNYLVFYWNWTDGKDLDIIAKFLSPNLGGEVGSRKGEQITNQDGSVVYMQWGGDNTEDTAGYEGIFIDVNALKQVPGGLTNNTVELDLRAMWYSEIGTDPVTITASGYQGGTMGLEKDTPNVPGFGFYNPTAAQTFTNFKETNGKVLTSVNREDSGQRLTRVIIDLSSLNLRFIEDD